MSEIKSLKQELVEQAKAIVEAEDQTHAYQQMQDLKKKWRRTREDEESLLDAELQQQFDEYCAMVAVSNEQQKQIVEENKKAIIAEAKLVLENKNYRQATDQMNALFDRWKASGRTDKETDDALWEEFRGVRNQFFANKKEYYANLRETFNKNKAAKEELIQQANAVLEMESINEASAKMDELMDSWKATGSAGHDNDEELWSQFKAARGAFFDKRKEYYNNLRATFAQRTEAKKELIAQAKLYLARSEFTEEEIAAVKDLRVQWKAVGNAGKENENTLWTEFNDLVNRYFENMRVYRK